MGTGGSGNLFSRKTELVADLTSAFKKLNAELEKTKKLSADIAKNIKGSFPGSTGGSQLFDTSSRSTGTNTPAQNDGTGGGSAGGINLLGILNTLGKGAGFALSAMPSVQQALTVNTAKSQFGFYGGKDAAGTMARVAANGTITDPLDPARAAMQGASQGLMPGLKNYGATVGAGTAMFSNLVPGASAPGGMGAMAALNQARSVNMAKMIGINIRGADGLMKPPEQIIEQIWASVKRNYGGGGNPTAEDISMSLQSGGGLAHLIDGYFGGDPVLRQGVINALYLKAGGAKTLSRSEMEKAGLTTKHLSGASDRNAAALKGIDAASEPLLKGFDAANAALVTLNEGFADLVTHSKALQAILQGKGFVDTMATGGNNAMGGLMGQVGGFLTTALGAKFAVKGLGGNAVKGATEAGKFGAKGLGKIIPLLAALLSGAEGFSDEKAGKGIWGDLLKNAGIGAAGGALFGGLPGAGIGALVGGGGYLLGRMFGHDGGDRTGGGENGIEGSGATVAMPLSGNPIITSPFGKVRHLITGPNGRHNASWGKPHGGVDYGVDPGTPVYAVRDGVAQDTYYDSNGFGNYGKVQHEDGKVSYYGHLNSINIHGGQKVNAGDLIGYSGNTGNSTGPHLHFEVRDAGNSIDPLSYIAGGIDSGTAASQVLDGSGTVTQQSSNSMKLTASHSANSLKLGSGGPGLTGAPEGTSRGSRNGGGSSVNYGGVNVTLNFPEGNYNKEDIKQAVKEVFQDDNLRKHAVSN
jgi:murein DD-endopeptidase MepM/ murein hydrolase activator NlpD